jgi:aminopeptidase N
MSHRILTFSATALALFGFGTLPAGAAQRVVLPTNVTPVHYQLSITPDAEKLTFDGQVQIDIQVKQATQTIQLNSADLTFKSAIIEGVGSLVSTFDAKKQTVSLRAPKVLKPGTYKLQIDYSGMILKSAAGLFALDYLVDGKTKRGLYTQFEPSDARRLFPCVDEPGVKATFELSARVPKDLMAVSNTPIIDSKDEANNMKTVQFGRTPKMSTYLLFFALGDFERIRQTVDGVDIGIVVKRGDTAKARFALEAASQILPFYEEYFGTKFPLPKMDLIAAPGTSQTFSAMENWGAILYFDRALLIDPAVSTELTKRYVYLVIAHEMAHQWFGDLVTMAWWDDLWLNEGFATWMEIYVTDHFHPEWKPWIFLKDAISDAMALDAKAGTHPIIQPILDVLQAGQAFDSITYQKGAAVIRMIQDYVGEDIFRSALRNYMQKYAYQNTVTDDLWKEVDAVSLKKKITTLAHDFTQKAGVPLINVKQVPKGWSLEQRVFSVDNSTLANQSWHVPVDATVLNGGPKWEGVVTRQTPATIKDEAKAGLFLNAQLSGYYRTHHDDKSFDALLSDFDNLPLEVQLSLIEDSRVLGDSGHVPMSRILLLAEHIGPKLNTLVLTRFVETLGHLDFFQDQLASQERFRAFALKFVRPIFAQIGWTVQKTDDANSAALRAGLIDLLGHMGDKEVVDKANAYFETFLKDRGALPAELRTSVLRVVADQADERRWQQIYELAKSAPSIIEQQQYYGLLAVSVRPELAQKALSLALDKNTPATVGPSLIKGVTGRFPTMAFDFAMTNYKWLLENLEPNAHTRFIAEMLRGCYERPMIAKLAAYAKKNIPATAMQSFRKTEASIRLNADIREKRIPEIDKWLTLRK